MSLNLLPFLQAIKQAEAPPSYIYNEKLDRYQNEKTGRLVSMKTVYKLLDGNEAVTTAVLDSLSQSLREKTISLSAWTLALQQQLSRLHVQNATLGAGGFDALKPKDFARIDAALRADWPRLAAFGQDIVAGKLSDKQISGRIVMYAGHARLQFYGAKPKPFIKQGQVVVERRVLRPGDNCAWCVYLAGLGWQPHGTLPLPGESGQQWEKSQCLTNCRCDMESKVIKRAEANLLIKPLASFFGLEYSYRNIIKGGPRSGNHGHAGIPGHQGGSQPTEVNKDPDLVEGMTKPNRQTFDLPVGTDSPVDDVLDSGSYDHPYLEMFLGEGIQSPAQANAMRGKRKGEIVGRLSEGIGLHYDDANDFIRQWSIAANDSDMRSLTIQELAAAEFGTELSSYQQVNVDEAKSRRQSVLARYLDDLPEDGIEARDAAQSLAYALEDEKAALPFEGRALGNFAAGTLSKSEFKTSLAQVEKTSRDNVSKAIRFTYDETQKRLAEHGITEIHLYRGAALPASVHRALKIGEPTISNGNALSSWSFGRGPADEFSDGHMNGYMPRGSKSVVFDAIVPASRIYATAVTGPGCLVEWEMIVIGTPNDNVRVYSIDGKRIGRSFKGGPGSGNHGHVGIPGHQGGSKPTVGGSVEGSTNQRKEKFGVPTETVSAVDDMLESYNFDHPLLEMYVGKQDKSTSISGWLEGVRTQRKGEIVARLMAGTSLTRSEANEFIAQWAVSSNDNDWASLSIQAAAADLFGADLTEWQKQRMLVVKTTRDYILNATLDGVDNNQDGDFNSWDAAQRVAYALGSAKPSVAFPFEKTKLNDLFLEMSDEMEGIIPKTVFSKADFLTRLAQVEQDSQKKVKEAISFTYAETQRTLADAGIKELHLFRGSVISEDASYWMKPGAFMDIESNALSSWSFAREVADDFSFQNGYYTSGGKLKSVVVDAVIPASRIYATAITGQGCLTEWEMIVIGSDDDQARIYRLEQDRVKAFIKGGEGSGNHGHEGIPGHQGGSKPTGKLRIVGVAGEDAPTRFETTPEFAQHPLMKLFAGDNPEFSSDGVFRVNVSLQLAQIQDSTAQLAEHLGVDERVAAQFLYAWADSSNDSSLKSLGVQEAAAEVFGVPLSDWQKEQLIAAQLKRSTKIAEEYKDCVEDYHMTPTEALDQIVNDLSMDEQYPFEDRLESVTRVKRAIRDGLQIESERDVFAWLDKSAQEGKAKAKQALTYIYDQTQAKFKAAGITHVTAYRGTTLRNSEVEHLSVGDMWSHTSNALSSWSLDSRPVSDVFLNRARSYESSLGLRNVIPVERIASISHVGLGSLPEWEIVLLGSNEPDTSEIYEIRKGQT